jgi:uncharacterized protein (TIRG00374 family)
MLKRHRATILRWLPGALLLVALTVIALRSVEWARFAETLQHANPLFLLAAIVVQLATYLCAAGVLHRGIKASGIRISLRLLLSLDMGKLFVDQMVPTGGLGGSMLLVRALERRGVRRGVATATVVVTTLAFYAAYIAAVACTLVILWSRHEVSRAILVLLTFFSIYATAMPVLILWIVYGGRRKRPPWLDRIAPLRKAVQALEEAPASTLRHPVLFLEAIGLQLLIIVLDALTLQLLLRSIGYDSGFQTAFSAFVLASIAATLSLLPGGVGSFEAGSVASLRYMGVPLEVCLAGTIIFRVLTQWLPLIPGIWIARREMMHGDHSAAEGVRAGDRGRHGDAKEGGAAGTRKRRSSNR